MRNFLCLVCVAGAIYTTRAAKREAVEKAAESARDGGISIGSELHSVAALGTTVPPLRTLLFRRASCLKNAAEPRRADL